jgi:thioesterase domain-containing protein
MAPWFCIHPGGGLSWCYMPLARYVPSDCPLYGLQARGLNGDFRLPGSMNEMAAYYVEQIRSVQPSGPYNLLGYSFGGIAAHEIAVQLQAAGEQEISLVLMDAYPTPQERSPVAGDGDSKPGPQPDEGATIGQPVPDDDMAGIMDIVRSQAGFLGEKLLDEDLMIFARVIWNNEKILRTHEPGRFTGNLLMITAADSTVQDVATARWEPYVSGKISKSAIPCRHDEMCQPGMLAQTWGNILTWLELNR